MLQLKLEEASQDSRRKRIRFIILLITILMFSTLLFFGVIKIDLSTFNITQEIKKQTPSSAFVYDSEHSVLKILPNKLSQKADINPVLDKKRLLVPNSPPQINEARNTFKEMLIKFEKSIEPIVLSEGFANWSIEEQQKILTKKNESIKVFGTGDHNQAVNRLRKADQYSSIQIKEYGADFRENLSKAEKSYEEDDYHSSFIHISQALRLKPQSIEAQKLKKKISFLPTVLKTIQKAVIARTENNLDLEIKFLSEVIDLDPSRYEIVDRLDVLKKQVLEQNFSSFIKKGLNSVGNKDLESARRYLKKAQSIFEGRSEEGLLSKKVKILELDLKVEDLVNKAKSASQKDNWLKAETFYKEARKLQPNRKDIEDNFSLAKKINALTGKLTTHLQAPRRLSSPNVAESVRALVVKAKDVAFVSPSLASKISTILELLESFSKKVRVRIISNGVTDVLVRGVGKVGLINEKVIELKPGKYTFEGKRTGYRSKLIQVNIPPNSRNIVVKIFSDERI